MGISFAKIGFWKLAGLGVTLGCLHLGLSSRWPELSPHSPGPLQLRAKSLVVAEYFVLMLTLMAAVGTIEAMIRAKDFKALRALSIALAYAAYLGFFWRVFH